jgi:hypothetical protein
VSRAWSRSSRPPEDAALWRLHLCALYESSIATAPARRKTEVANGPFDYAEQTTGQQH